MGGAVRRGSCDADAIPPEVTPPTATIRGTEECGRSAACRGLSRSANPLYHLRTWLLPDCTGRVDFRPFGVLTFDTPNAYINSFGTPPPRCDGASSKLLTEIR